MLAISFLFLFAFGLLTSGASEQLSNEDRLEQLEKVVMIQQEKFEKALGFQGQNFENKLKTILDMQEESCKANVKTF